MRTYYFQRHKNMDDNEEMGTKVELYVYDLTKGAATIMSQLLIGIFINIKIS